MEYWCIYYEGATGGSDTPEFYTSSFKYQELEERKRFAQNVLDIYNGANKGIKD